MLLYWRLQMYEAARALPCASSHRVRILRFSFSWGMRSISVQHQDWQAFVLWKGCLGVSFVRKGSDLIFRFPILHLKKSKKIASGTIPYHSLLLHNCWRKKSGDHQLRLVAYPIIYKVLYKPGGCLGNIGPHSPKTAVFVAKKPILRGCFVEVWNEVHLNVLGPVLGPWGHPLLSPQLGGT